MRLVYFVEHNCDHNILEINCNWTQICFTSNKTHLDL